jgi:ribosomal protein L11 methylase PrmA
MKKAQLIKSKNSFRDPAGYITHDMSGKIYRIVTNYGKENFDFVEKAGLYKDLTKNEKLILHTKEDIKKFNILNNVAYILSHPTINFISYPYEWSFEQLRDAALLHLDIHIQSLAKNITLSDASAYNIQFIGNKPIFIDTLSFIKYEEGMFWKGQRQFIEQFITPLLLWSKSGIHYNDWYRGAQNGIPAKDLNKILPIRKKLSLAYFNFISLPCFFDKKSSNNTQQIKGKLPKTALVMILKQLQSWVINLKNSQEKTIWKNYTTQRNYSDQAIQDKASFVNKIIFKAKPNILWDLGCNTGEFSFHALKLGVKNVIGFETDHNAISTAYLHSKNENSQFLPLYMNLANPSPDSGWNQNEKLGLFKRKNADFILALAIIHHLVISNNIPLNEVIEYITELAPKGIIEWVPKSDKMIKNMLLNRDDIFFDYNEENFISYLQKSAKIIESKSIADSGRKLFHYKK